MKISDDLEARARSGNQYMENLQNIERNYPGLFNDCLPGNGVKGTEQQGALLSVAFIEFDVLWNQWRESACFRGFKAAPLLELENVISVIRALT